jgi:hypothetical protein
MVDGSTLATSNTGETRGAASAIAKCATSRGAAPGARSIEVCDEDLFSIVMSIQQPRAHVTTQYRGKFGELRRAGLHALMAGTALIAP